MVRPQEINQPSTTITPSFTSPMLKPTNQLTQTPTEKNTMGGSQSSMQVSIPVAITEPPTIVSSPCVTVTKMERRPLPIFKLPNLPPVTRTRSPSSHTHTQLRG